MKVKEKAERPLLLWISDLGKQAFPRARGNIWLPTLQSLSPVSVAVPDSARLSAPFNSGYLISTLGTQLDIRLLSSLSSFIHCVFRARLIFLSLKQIIGGKGGEKV